MGGVRKKASKHEHAIMPGSTGWSLVAKAKGRLICVAE